MALNALGFAYNDEPLIKIVKTIQVKDLLHLVHIIRSTALLLFLSFDDVCVYVFPVESN